MTENKAKPTLPEVDDFREWVVNAVKALSLKPSALAGEIGVGVNTVAAFMRDKERGVTLSVARRIEVALRAHAARQGVDLPAMGADGEGAA